MKKRIFAMLLTVVMVFGYFGVNVFAADWREEPAPINESSSQVNTITVDNKVYLFDFGNSTSNKKNIQIFDISTNTWSVGSEEPTLHSSNGNVTFLYGRDIYIYDGYGYFNIYNIDNDSWRESTVNDFLEADYITASSVAKVGSQVYIFGGMSTSTVKYHDTFYIYNLENETWSVGGTLPIAIQGTNARVVGENIYVMGGNVGQSVNVRTVYIYNTATDSWTQGSDMLINPPNFASVTSGRKIYIFYATYLDVYDTEDDEWQRLSKYPLSAWIGYDIEIFNNRLYVIAKSGDKKMVSYGLDGAHDNILSVLLEESETVRMSVTDNFADNTQYTWTSSDPSVASVVNGTVTALSPGLTYITAESADGTFRESIPVRVVGQGEAADERLAVYLNPSESKNLYLNDDLAAITWSSMDTAVASVDTAGRVTGVGSGLTIVQARYQDETHQVYVRVS